MRLLNLRARRIAIAEHCFLNDLYSHTLNNTFNCISNSISLTLKLRLECAVKVLGIILLVAYLGTRCLNFCHHVTETMVFSYLIESFDLRYSHFCLVLCKRISKWRHQMLWHKSLLIFCGCGLTTSPWYLIFHHLLKFTTLIDLKSVLSHLVLKVTKSSILQRFLLTSYRYSNLIVFFSRWWVRTAPSIDSNYNYTRSHRGRSNLC